MNKFGIGQPVRRVEDLLGVDHLDMPATPSRVWEAIKGARANA